MHCFLHIFLFLYSSFFIICISILIPLYHADANTESELRARMEAQQTEIQKLETEVRPVVTANN